MSQLQISAGFPSLPEENLENFEKLAAECLEVVMAEDLGTMHDDWFFSEDGRPCVVRETYAGSDALLTHMGNLGDLLGESVGPG